MISYHGVSIILSRTIAIIDSLINALMYDCVFLSTFFSYWRFWAFRTRHIQANFRPLLKWTCEKCCVHLVFLCEIYQSAGKEEHLRKLVAGLSDHLDDICEQRYDLFWRDQSNIGV